MLVLFIFYLYLVKTKKNQYNYRSNHIKAKVNHKLPSTGVSITTQNPDVLLSKRAIRRTRVGSFLLFFGVANGLTASYSFGTPAISPILNVPQYANRQAVYVVLQIYTRILSGRHSDIHVKER
ncbi:hypothetical protein PFLUV_G00083010 [Perca fluviatilis]|uniref:Uncharacterized protein n=1 Tax=Perca fluviatilis TaxID=8168 RepID=A0A6A5EER2_PERFL|nr:hypothetical protein PFLUV_G00083010 [Perca fluviatilis]